MIDLVQGVTHVHLKNTKCRNKITAAITFAVVWGAQDFDGSKKSFLGQMQRWHEAAKNIILLRITVNYSI
jgi:hypothetical protein